MGSTVEPFCDPLSAALWDARLRGTPVEVDEAWSELEPGRASGISAELYRRISSEPPAAWKMGAVDGAMQNRLGLSGPLVAPVLHDRLHLDTAQVAFTIEDFVQPKLEAEIGVAVTASGRQFVPCVEVADCRFDGWALPPGAAIADFGLQGAMVFGMPTPYEESVRVVVRHDGAEVCSAEARWSDAEERLRLLPPPERDVVHVATGAMTPLLPVEPGRWDFDFQDLGVLSLSFS